MDKIIIDKLQVALFIGIFPHEKEEMQEIFISIELQVNDCHKAAYYDNIKYAIDYDSLSQAIIAGLAGKHINLIETVAQQVSDICLQNKLVQSCRIRIDKPTAVKQSQSVAVEITRQSPF